MQIMSPIQTSMDNGSKIDKRLSCNPSGATMVYWVITPIDDVKSTASALLGVGVKGPKKDL